MVHQPAGKKNPQGPMVQAALLEIIEIVHKVRRNGLMIGLMLPEMGIPVVPHEMLFAIEMKEQVAFDLGKKPLHPNRIGYGG